MGAVEISAWFDPRGRLSRRAYGRLVIRLALVSATLFCVAIALAAQGWRTPAFAALAAVGVPWLASLALTIRRLHDRGLSGWWLSLSLALTALSFVPVERQADAYPVAVVIYTLVIVAATVWFLIETFGRRGDAGSNRYGPEPTP